MKNFKLLLATTAILSVGLITSVWAEVSNPEATLTANVRLANSITVSPMHHLQFGLLDAANGGTLTVNPDGTYDGTAIVLNPSGIAVGRIGFSGGGIMNMANQQSNNQPFLNSIVTLVIDDNKEIILGQCGKVTNLTQGPTTVSSDKIVISFGGTFEMDEDVSFSGEEISCTGNTTVTYVLGI